MRSTRDRPAQDEISDCIAACFGCILVCNRCSDGLIGMETSGNAQLMQSCIRLCRDCADICTLTARWISRTSPWAEQACHLCAQICDRCAESCELLAPHHALCGVCAHECRRCGELCRQIAVNVRVSAGHVDPSGEIRSA